MKKLWAITIGLLLIFGGTSWLARAANQESAGGPAKKVTALGTIEPAEVVDVGAEVAGIVTEITADYGDKVESSQKLAQIGRAKYEALVEQAEAQLSSANAALDLAKANVENADALLRRDDNLRKAVPGTLLPDQYDTDKAAAGVAKAQVGVARAAVKQADANLKLAKLDLDRTIIRSPVKGVVIDRRVNRGQTVTGALNSSSLFLIGDIEKLQVWASVKETDIAKIRPRQAVRFKVDAFPGKVFDGTVTRIRLNATMLKDAVTYTVVIAIPKTEQLLPYMTAEVEFE